MFLKLKQRYVFHHTCFLVSKIETILENKHTEQLFAILKLGIGPEVLTLDSTQIKFLPRGLQMNFIEGTTDTFICSFSTSIQKVLKQNQVGHLQKFFFLKKKNCCC